MRMRAPASAKRRPPAIRVTRKRIRRRAPQPRPARADPHGDTSADPRWQRAVERKRGRQCAAGARTPSSPCPPPRPRSRAAGALEVDGSGGGAAEAVAKAPHLARLGARSVGPRAGRLGHRLEQPPRDRLAQVAAPVGPVVHSRPAGRRWCRRPPHARRPRTPPPARCSSASDTPPRVIAAGSNGTPGSGDAVAHGHVQAGGAQVGRQPGRVMAGRVERVLRAEDVLIAGAEGLERGLDLRSLVLEQPREAGGGAEVARAAGSRGRWRRSRPSTARRWRGCAGPASTRRRRSTSGTSSSMKKRSQPGAPRRPPFHQFV